jgi:hypothetical protein
MTRLAQKVLNMPRFFFHVVDGYESLDTEGTDLPDLATARNEAVTMSGQILRDGGGETLWAGTPWRLWVTDDTGATLFTLRFSSTESGTS